MHTKLLIHNAILIEEICQMLTQHTGMTFALTMIKKVLFDSECFARSMRQNRELAATESLTPINGVIWPFI